MVLDCGPGNVSTTKCYDYRYSPRCDEIADRSGYIQISQNR